MRADNTKAELREDMSSQYPQNLYRAIFGTPVEPESAEELGHMLGDRGALEIAMVLANLSNREADVLRYRYQQCRTYEEISYGFDLSKERIRQIEHKALRKMKRSTVARLLKIGVVAWLEEQVQAEAKSIADAEVPRRVYDILTERIAFAEEHMQKREEEVLRLARDGDQQDVKTILAENITIEEMELSVRAYNCLKRAGLNNMADIVAKTHSEMMCIRNLGRKSLEEVEQKVKELGFELKPEVEE